MTVSLSMDTNLSKIKDDSHLKPEISFFDNSKSSFKKYLSIFLIGGGLLLIFAGLYASIALKQYMYLSMIFKDIDLEEGEKKSRLSRALFNLLGKYGMAALFSIIIGGYSFFSYIFKSVDESNYFSSPLKSIGLLVCFSCIFGRLFTIFYSIIFNLPAFISASVLALLSVGIVFYFLRKKLSVHSFFILIPAFLFFFYQLIVILVGARIIKFFNRGSSNRLIDAFNEKQKNLMLPILKKLCKSSKVDINNITYILPKSTSSNSSSIDNDASNSYFVQDITSTFICHNKINPATPGVMPQLVELSNIFLINSKIKRCLKFNLIYFVFSLLTLGVFFGLIIHFNDKMSYFRIFILLTTIFILLNHFCLDLVVSHFNKKLLSYFIDISKIEGIDDGMILVYFHNQFKKLPEFTFQSSIFRYFSYLLDYETIFKIVTDRPFLPSSSPFTPMPNFGQ